MVDQNVSGQSAVSHDATGCANATGIAVVCRGAFDDIEKVGLEYTIGFHVKTLPNKEYNRCKILCEMDSILPFHLF